MAEGTFAVACDEVVECTVTKVHTPVARLAILLTPNCIG